ncbi:LysR family transcriptional regulator [Falsochrobactrum sp. TDYN1]|uniref:LysR family transcriptional regulator n=1 Tax=Falsochrobactrum tianjinense TaxID=2706015 RepID=A0A949UWD2_9HYPH|nr:LysR family transcriptional regulator [Falsochrobactrum sp. TDYN1]MBV2144943.1 LysR family transcriptional regulator [Falsochrobactrum sp. TDYN1]
MTVLRRTLPSMNGLFTLEAAARHGNFSKAAQELNVTPAAISRMIGRLEEHLDVQLFIRKTSGVTLTEYGKILHDAIERGFAGIEQALREINDRKQGVQTVTLSLSTGFTTHWVMPRMAAFKKTFPGVDLRFELIMGPLAGPVNDVDLGMRFVEGGDDNHEATFVMREVLVPICSPTYQREHNEENSVLDQPVTTLINLSEAQPNWPDFFLSAHGRGGAHDEMLFSDYAIVVQAALLGQGVAIGWLNVVAHWLRTQALIPAHNRFLPTHRKCHLVRLRDKPVRPIVTQVRDWLIAELMDDIRAITAMYPSLSLEEALQPPQNI